MVSMVDFQRPRYAASFAPPTDFVEIGFAIEANCLAELNAHILGNVVFAVGFEGGDDFVGGDTGCGRIPEREGVDAVRVYVLGAFFQFGKAHEPISRRFVSGRVDFDENREVALDDEGIFRVVVHILYAFYRGVIRTGEAMAICVYPPRL